MSYPKWKFSGDQSQLVHTPDEEQKLGAAWGDTPGYAAPSKAAHPVDEKDHEKDHEKDPAPKRK